MATGTPRSVRGSAVLVHGAWSNPEDWQWVRRVLEAAGVHVVAPDLPSHHSPAAGLLTDAEEVRRVVRECPPPVVLVGWSYGGSVISIAGDAQPSVVRLVYVATVPREEHQGDDAGWLDEELHVHLVEGGGMHVLDNEWWLNEEAGTTFPPEIVDHLRRHPRRPASVTAETDPQPAAAWRTAPTTVLLGDHDQLISLATRRWAVEHLSDVRVLHCDHFILFRDPGAITDVVIEALAATAEQD